MMKIQTLLIAIATASVIVFGATSVVAAGDSADVIDHGPFEEILEKYVDDKGMVDYAGLKTSERDRRSLRQYVHKIAETPAAGATQEAQKAFLINAYNALVIFDVIERWPVENVTEEDGFFDGKRHGVAKGSLTLDRLEKKFIHERFDDPRTHFAVICAAKSCPRLPTSAYTADNVDEMLESVTREYIPEVTKVGEDKVETSQLFQWYGERFVREAGSVQAYLARYVDDDIAEMELEFSEYDWSINSQ